MDFLIEKVGDREGLGFPHQQSWGSKRVDSLVVIVGGRREWTPSSTDLGEVGTGLYPRQGSGGGKIGLPLQ
jgi:hypothetical protein